MRVVLWCTAAVLILSAVVATPAQAGFPSCREMTEKFPSEYMEGRYLRIRVAVIENWHEWNGYEGLQTRKCVTEYGVLLGSDTLESAVDASQPGEMDPDLPQPPQPPQGPGLPGICRSGDNPTLGEIIQACTRIPDPPSGLPSTGGPDCGPGIVPATLLECFADPDDPPAAAYINWLQYVLAWMGEG